MKRLCFVLVCLAVPLQLGARAQSQPQHIAYDFCGPALTEDGWVILCAIQASSGVSPMWGTHPEWSADGLRIAASYSGLTIYNLADGSATILPDTGSVERLRWSPNDAKIAFTSYRDSVQELFVINADGSDLTSLTDNVGFRGGYAWSPDGTTIAFGATADGVPELFLMQADGTNKIRLTHNAGFDTNPSVPYMYRSAPSWSPDGTRIAFDCGTDICTINVDGTNLTRLTGDDTSAYAPEFSPVDGRIAVNTPQSGRIEVAILEENGALTRLAPGRSAMQHSWARNGQRLAFVEPRPDSCMQMDNRCVPGEFDMVYSVEADGSGLQEVGAGHHPRWGAVPAGQPAAAFTFNCSGADCQFDATSSFDSDGTINNYAWDFGDGTMGAGATASHHYATGSSYIVKLTVTDNAGAVGVATRNVTANAPPVASFTVMCDGPTCTFDGSASADSDGTIARYTWTFGDDSSLQASTTTATHVYRSGTFLPSLQVTDNGGLVTTSGPATVTVVNAFPVASFTVSCVHLACTFDASASTDDDGINQYYWNFGDGSGGSAKVATHTYLIAGTYQTRLMVFDWANQATESTRSVTAAPAPILEMHVGNLSSSSTAGQKTWNTVVTVQMHGADHQVLAGVTVNGSWSDGSTGACQTNASGNCALARNGLPTKTNSITLTIAGATFGTYVYKPAANHDVDGGSNGTSIVVKRR